MKYIKVKCKKCGDDVEKLVIRKEGHFCFNCKVQMLRDNANKKNREIKKYKQRIIRLSTEK